MNIGFDAKRYFHNNTGLGNYSRDLVNALCRQFPEHHYFLFDKHPDHTSLPENAQAITPGGNSILWRSRGIVSDITKQNLDLFHGLSNELPYGKLPANIQKVVTIHDVIFRHFPKHYKFTDRFIYHRKTTHAATIADKIIATSKATAADLMEYYGIAENKLHVVYQTCGPLHWHEYSDQTVNTFRKEKQLEHRFILYVSSFQQRKNHLQLLKALNDCSDKNIYLVLAGRKGETYESCVEYIASHKLQNRVTLLTDLGAKELPLLYRSAQSFIYPSMTEGFGIPLLEAACAGLPMAVNDIPVFREILPSQGLLFDIRQHASLTEILPVLYKHNKQDYSNYLKNFTPESGATQTMAVYKG